MMDFLKQNGDGDLDKLDAAGKDKLDAELGSDSSFVTTASHEKKVKNGTVILAVVFCVSLVCLWFMIKKTTPQAAAAKTVADETQIESAIAKITGTKAEFFKGIDNVVGKFYEFSNVLQVRVTDLKKNPFEHKNYANTEVANIPSEEESALEQEKTIKFNLEKEATGMQLLSIMKSPRGNSCMINDRILHKGDKIENWEVAAITDKTVELSAQGMRKILKISSD
jgi:preprotein translocase subunit SecG